MIRLTIIITALASIFLLSCESTTYDRDRQTPFRFSIQVTDDDGNGVAGLRVSGWNDVDGVDPVDVMADRTQISPLATTTIGFVVASESRVNLSIFDLKDRPVVTLVDQVLTGGARYVAWGSAGETPSGVYKCRMVASDTLSGQVLFRDSVYAVKWQADPEQSIYGYTGAAGVFETTNDLLFPNVLDNVPELILTNEVGAVLGTFRYENLVTIVLTETTTGATQQLRRAVTKGENELHVTWDPPPTPIPTGTNQSVAAGMTADRSDTTSPDFQWQLEQNFPNPFN